jgi:hypothetical protein
MAGEAGDKLVALWNFSGLAASVQILNRGWRERCHIFARRMNGE